MPKGTQLLERARALAAAGNYDAALPLLDEVAAQHTSLAVRAYRSKALIYGRMKDYRQSVDWWEESLKLNPYHADGWYQMGMCYFRFAEFGTALACYRRAGELGLSRPGLQQNIDACRRNLESGRDYANEWQIHFQNAATLFASARMAEAQSESALALHLARQHGNRIGEAFSLAQLGRCKAARGQLVEALSDLRKAEHDVAPTPDDDTKVTLLHALGLGYRDMGLLSKAIWFFEVALRVCRAVEPLDMAAMCDASADLGRCYLDRNRIGGDDRTRAEAILLDAVRAAAPMSVRTGDEARPKARVWEVLGCVYLQTGDLGRAIDCLAFSRACIRQPSIEEPDLARLGQSRSELVDLLPIIDLLAAPPGGAAHGEEVRSRIARLFSTA